MPATAKQDAEYRSLVTDHAGLTNNPHTVTLTQAAAAGGTLGIGNGGTGRTSWNADSFAITDGLGVFSSGGIAVPSGDVVGTTATQTLTNKTIGDTLAMTTGGHTSASTGAAIGFEFNVTAAGHTGDHFQIDDNGSAIWTLNQNYNVEMANNDPRKGGIYQSFTEASYPAGGTVQPKNAWYANYDGALANNKSYRMLYVQSNPRFNSASSGMSFFGGYFEVKNQGSTAGMNSSEMVGGKFVYLGQQSAGDLTNSTVSGGQFIVSFSGAGTETHTNVTGGQFQADPSGGTNNVITNLRVGEFKGPAASLGAGSSVTNWVGIYIHDQRNDRIQATNHDAIRIESQTADGSVATDGNINFIGGAYNTGHICLTDTSGTHIWRDGTNSCFRFKNSAPTADTQGVGFLDAGETGAQTPTLSANLPAAAAATASATWLPVYIGATKGWIAVWQ